jgi:tetratricopeptide (TPR) repeat protein
MFGRLSALGMAAAVVLTCLGAGAWWRTANDAPNDDDSLALPLPPFPPRITEGREYETCLASLADDPAGAVAMAEAWQATGGGEGARHCEGLALIALGKPAAGAAVLEELAGRSNAPPLARASVLGQAGQAWMMVSRPDRAADDASRALDLAPEDSALFIMRASAEGMLNRYQAAIDDLDAALRLDAARPDALVARAVARRKMGQLDMAQADVSRALALDPDDADALLERGILRQRMGDPVGARTDWEHARGVDPNSTTADLAQQNLSLLEAGGESSGGR